MKLVSYVSPLVFVGILHAIAIPTKDPPSSDSASHQLSTITTTQDQTNLNPNTYPTDLHKRKNEPTTPEEIHRDWTNTGKQSLTDAQTKLTQHKGRLDFVEDTRKFVYGGIGPTDPEHEDNYIEMKRITEADVYLDLPDHAYHLQRTRALHDKLPDGHSTKAEMAKAIANSERYLKWLKDSGIEVGR